MQKLFFSVLFGFGILLATGCDNTPDAQINTEPLTEEQKRQIAADDKNIDDEESPGNKTLKPKKGRR